MKQIANTIGLANAFIMSVIVTIISMIDGYLLAFLVGVALLVPLILIIYHLIGKYYQNKQKGKI
jgi:hypothetical protein